MAYPKGLDLSEWNTTLTYANAKAAGYSFVILRDGYGTSTKDKMFDKHITGCKNAGLEIHGIYHFIYAISESEALQNAKNAVALVQAAGLPKTTRIWADFEYDTITKASAKGVILTEKHANSFTKKFCEYVASQGYPTGVYMNNDYYKNYYDDEIKSKYEIWLADYSGGADYKCMYHQYSSSGSISGSSARYDCNYYIGEQKSKTSSATTTATVNKTEDVKMADIITTTAYSSYIYSTGTHYISNSGSDENGGAHGGIAGDNTGREWQMRSWYNRPWSCMIRYEKDQRVGQALANMGCAAALNDKIGYDQYQRDTYWQHLKASNYDPRQVTIACESDCSAGVIAHIKAVGHLLGIPALQNITCTYTGNMRSALRNAGFTVYTGSSYIASTANLYPGDILLNDEHHVCTNVTKGSNVKIGSTTTTASNISVATTTSSSTTLKKGSTGTAVKELQQNLIKLGYSCGNAGADGDFGTATENAVKLAQKALGITVDGIVGSQTQNAIKKALEAMTNKVTTASGQTTVTKSEYPFVGIVTGISSYLNVRTGASTSSPIQSAYPKLTNGNGVNVLGKQGAFYKVAINNKITNNKDVIGYVSAQYIKKA